VRDFTTVFDTYAQFEESVLSAKMAAEDDDEDEDEVRDEKLEKETATHPFTSKK
jgi:pre-mRNA-splicing factor SYF1